MAQTTKTAAKKTTNAPKADAAPTTVKFVKGTSLLGVEVKRIPVPETFLGGRYRR